MAARVVWRHIAVNEKKLAKEEFSAAFTLNGAPSLRAEESRQIRRAKFALELSA
jgi:hypothetical protein